MCPPIPRYLSVVCLLVAAASSGCAGSRSGMDAGATPAAGPLVARGATETQQEADPQLRQARLVRELAELCDADRAEAEVARSTARTATVRAFATSVYDQRAWLTEEVDQLWGRFGLIELRRSQQELVAAGTRERALELTARRGTYVDRAFLESVVDGHRRRVDKLRSLAARTERRELRELIESQFLPLEKQNLRKAREILASGDTEVSLAVR